MTDAPNPMSAAQRLARPETPRRFYQHATAGPHDLGFAVLLDGKIARTPSRNFLAVEDRRLADALAAEWEAQTERLDPTAMPLTRIVNSAIDHVASAMAAVRGEIVKYAGSDLISYRADGPQSLVAAQAAAWAPLVAWAREILGSRLSLSEGVVHVKQEPAALEAIDAAVSEFDPLALAALSTVTSLTGSAIIALALARQRLTADEAWAVAHVDEEWQMSKWGRDEAALALRAARKRELDAAALILGLR